MGREAHPAGLKELHWALSKDLQNEVLDLLFHQGDDTDFAPERGFIGIVYPGDGVIRRTLFLREIVPQESGWVASTGRGLSFSPRYFSRALDAVSSATPGAGLIVVHSHPGLSGSPDVPPRPSGPDLYHERRLLFQLARALPAGSSVAAGIVTRSGAWRVREYRWPRPRTAGESTDKNFGINRASHMDASAVRVVSVDSLVVYHHDGPRTALKDARAVDSTLRLWGEGGQRILCGLRVGIAGLGGVGSILAEFLARLGIGEIVLVDFDLVSQENMNRLVGARRNDIGKPKVDYASRIAKDAATYRAFKVRSCRASASEGTGLKPLLDADIILNAADNAFVRQVLDHAAYAYLIPVLDGGTRFVVDSQSGKVVGRSQVTGSGPGQPCLECSGVYSQEEATLAREPPAMQGPDSYVQVTGGTEGTEPPRAPSVISHNGFVAALLIQRMLSLVLDFPPRRKVGQQRYYVEQGELLWGPTERCKDGCPKSSWVSLGNSHPVPVGIDPYWKELRERPSPPSRRRTSGDRT